MEPARNVSFTRAELKAFTGATLPDLIADGVRLLFVGITRAREELQLSYAQYRAFRGQACPTVPSSFLMELPRREMDLSDSVGSRRTTPDWEEGFEPGTRDDSETDASQVTKEEDADFAQEEPLNRRKREKTSALTSGLVTGADLLAKHEKRKVVRIAHLDKCVENRLIDRELRGHVPHCRIDDVAEEPL